MKHRYQFPAKIEKEVEELFGSPGYSIDEEWRDNDSENTGTRVTGWLIGHGVVEGAKLLISFAGANRIRVEIWCDNGRWHGPCCLPAADSVREAIVATYAYTKGWLSDRSVNELYHEEIEKLRDFCDMLCADNDWL